MGNVRHEVSATVVVSTLGYCILPIVGLSGLGVLVTLNGLVGTITALLAVTWCSLSASKLFVTAFDMEHQQLLVAYPCSLLYGLFALINKFVERTEWRFGKVLFFQTLLEIC